MHSRLDDKLPAGPGQRLTWDNVFGAAGGYLAARAAAAHDGPVLIVANDAEDAVRWQNEVAFFSTHGAGGINLFPDWETLPYDVFSPHPDIVSERLATLRALGRLRRGVLVVSVTALMQRLAPPEYVEAHSFVLAAGEVFDTHRERDRLQAAGYTAVETVENRGEFAVRGSLMDIFPAGAPNPIRIDLMDDEIESLRLFDADTQRTVERVASIRMLPAKEFPFDDAGIARFRNRWHETFDVDVRACSVYRDVSAGLPPGGIEYYLPFFFDRLATLFDYLRPDTLVLHRSDVGAAATHFRQDIENRYESLAYDIERPILPPDRLFLTPERLQKRLRNHPRIALGDRPRAKARRRSRMLPDLQANARLREPAQSLKDFIAANQSERFLFTAESAGRREVLSDFLARAGIRAEGFPALPDFLSSDAPCGSPPPRCTTGSGRRPDRRHGKPDLRPPAHGRTGERRPGDRPGPDRSRPFGTFHGSARRPPGARHRPLSGPADAQRRRIRQRVPDAGICRRRQAVRAGHLPAPHHALHRRGRCQRTAAPARFGSVGESQAPRGGQGRRCRRRIAEYPRTPGRQTVGAPRVRSSRVRSLRAPVSIRTHRGPGPGHRCRHRRARLGESHRPSGVRGRRVRQDGGGPARRIRHRAGRQAGRGAGADDAARPAAPRYLQRPLRRLAGTDRGSLPVAHRRRDGRDSRANGGWPDRHPHRHPQAARAVVPFRRSRAGGDRRGNTASEFARRSGSRHCAPKWT